MHYFCTLASGSSGNAALYVSGRARILIDAGSNCKTIRAALALLDLKPADLTDILITHTHSDHVSALPVLLGHTGAQLWCSPGARDELCAAAGEERPQALEVGREQSISGVRVRAFATLHDSPGSVGYILGEGAGAVGYCTDLGCVTGEVLEALAGVPTLVMESNHDVDMLRSGPYPYFLKKRILSDTGHLSNRSCASALETLVQKGARRVVLAHLSEKNNTPRHADAESRLALYRLGAQDDVALAVAPRRGLCGPLML